MQTRVEIREDTAIVRFAGAVNVRHAKELEQALGQWIARGARRIILDVGGLNYVGALAVSVIVSSFCARWPDRVPIEMAALPRGVLDDLAKNDVMPPAGVYASVAEAVRANHSPSPDEIRER